MSALSDLFDLLDAKAARQKRFEKYESPIEAQLGEALVFYFGYRFPPNTVQIIPQYRLGRFRYDFAIKFTGKLSARYGDRPVFLIECDGADYHGAEEYWNDIAKDAAAIEAGSYCLRYRGSIIHRNPCVLAEELTRAVEHMRRWAMASVAIEAAS